MSVNLINSDEKAQLTVITKQFIHKLIQIIVQSRFGQKASTKCRNKSSDRFNIELEDSAEISAEAKKLLGNQLPDADNPLCIEIYAYTPERQNVVLEMWTLSVNDNPDLNNTRNVGTALDRITERFQVLLKSAIVITRVTPAYKMSFKQAKQSFVMCYKFYFGAADIDNYGEKYTNYRVGQVATPLSSYVLSVCYRKNYDTLSRASNIGHEAIMIKSDYFKPESSPKQFRKNSISSKNQDQKTTQSSDDSHEGTRINSTMPQDIPQHTSQESDSSKPSSLSTQPLIERKISAAFAEAKEVNPEDFIVSDIPLSSLFITSKIEAPLKEESESKDKSSTPHASPKASNSKETEKGLVGSDTCVKSTVKEEDYVLVQLKTPFGNNGPSDTIGEIGALYRACQSAPPLQAFAQTPEEQPPPSYLDEQLQSFEASVNDYDELVRSLHSDSPGGLE